jgi:hypothetical protein
VVVVPGSGADLDRGWQEARSTRRVMGGVGEGRVDHRDRSVELSPDDP